MSEAEFRASMAKQQGELALKALRCHNVYRDVCEYLGLALEAIRYMNQMSEDAAHEGVNKDPFVAELIARIERARELAAYFDRQYRGFKDVEKVWR